MRMRPMPILRLPHGKTCTSSSTTRLLVACQDKERAEKQPERRRPEERLLCFCMEGG